jgi:hypothetical protein
MIVREYTQNINTYRPRNYFERWYADMWRQFINAPTAPPGIVERFMTQELAKINASYTYTDNGYKFRVTFNNDAEYTAFVLRWS